jgi:hypothetical protein
MGKVLIQMSADADSEVVAGSPDVFKWPAPPAKEEKANETSQEEASTTTPIAEAEPAALPVFFCK